MRVRLFHMVHVSIRIRLLPSWDGGEYLIHVSGIEELGQGCREVRSVGETAG